MKSHRSKFMHFALLLTFVVLSEAKTSKAGEPNYDGFGFYAPQIWKNVAGKTARLSICDCDHDIRCFSEQILFRSPEGGFLILDRKDLHEDSLARIDSGLKKMDANRSRQLVESEWRTWKGKNGRELSLKLVAADSKMAAFVDKENHILTTLIENLDRNSREVLASTVSQKFGAGKVRLVAQVTSNAFEKKILDGIAARKDEIKLIGSRDGGIPQDKLDSWFDEVKSGVSVGLGVEWKVPVKSAENKAKVEAALRDMLFTQLFQLLSLENSAYEKLKASSKVVAFEQSTGTGTGTGTGEIVVGDDEFCVPCIDALPTDVGCVTTASFVTSVSSCNPEANCGMQEFGSSNACCESNENASRCRLIGWLRRMR